MSPEVVHERATKFSIVCDILERYEHKQTMLIPILQAVQEEYHYLPQEVLEFIAASLRIPPARVYGVATFYAHFALKPKGKYLIRICDGTACHVKESIPILEKIREILRLPANQSTTDDLLFTVETVSCLGACGLAPVVVINEKVHACMTPAKVETVLYEIIACEKEAKT
ncbi:MAG: NAD(P)H-dependent oxidoreductase subunit E [Bacteroidetes bacterium]|nr:NAD(P)H-dependent oxidoreductase subunit E [Bacteroidota bacterium]